MTASKRKQEASTELGSDFASDLMTGLSGQTKFIPSRYLYDKQGSKLFEEICRQPEYYPTRTEAAILEKYSPLIAETAQGSQGVSIIELGSGSSTKTRILLREMRAERVCYFPIDISQSILEENAEQLMSEFPGIRVSGISCEFRQGIKHANSIISQNDLPQKKLVLFLGSSIGNFEENDAVSFLRMVRENMDSDDLLLIGFDLRKDKRILDSAYNDEKGITAQFNLNLLDRINRELQGEFDRDKFDHVAFYNDREGRIEMHLSSREDQNVYIGALGRNISFESGETIHTENSYKYDLAQIRSMAHASGFTLKKNFTDKKKWFCLALFSIEGRSQNI